MKESVRFVSYSSTRMASYRYRTAIPAEGLHELGYDCKIIRADGEAPKGVYIFSKHFNPKEEYMFAKKLKDPNFEASNLTSVVAGEDKGRNAIIFDVCDNHFDGEIGEYYKQMIGLSDYVVAATDRMKKVVAHHCPDADITVIKDSYEFSERNPRYNWEQKEIENLLWFGHPTNIKHLQKVWNDLGGHNIMLITEEGVSLEVDGKPFPIVPWSMDSMLWGFAQSDVVVLPNEGEKSCKGANRIIESIRQGVFVIAEPCPAYEEFKEWMYIGNIKEGLEWCNSNKGELQGRILKAQDYIRGKYVPRAKVEQWQNLIQRASKDRFLPKDQETEGQEADGQEEQEEVLSQG